MILLTIGTAAVAVRPGQEVGDRYLTVPIAERSDPIAQLQKRLDAGTLKLKYDGQHGYLPAVLDALGISPSSQILVFSKTSFQHQRISPRTPRALYFNDSTYVGWVRQGDVLEFATNDPVYGTNFYVLSQEPTGHPRFERRTFDCLQCHSTPNDDNRPRLMFRSVFPQADGTPDLSLGSFLTRPDSPLSERWGGWYVTGKHGSERHMGNAIVRESENYASLDRERGANRTELSAWFDTTETLTPHSDIVALMVAEHQADMLNLLLESRNNALDTLKMNQLLHADLKGKLSESSQERMNNIAEKLVRALLCADEVALKEPISGTSGFAGRFSSLGPRDAKGRSLRQLNLKTRLFQYPCSYLIHSRAFDALPPELRTCVFDRLHQVLTAETAEAEYRRLTREDRQAILEILAATKPDFPK